LSGSQTILVSGGSRGLGQAIVERLLANGHRVATFSRSPTPFVEELMADADLNERFLHASIDAADVGALRSFVQTTNETFGELSALINNAAVAHDTVLAMVTEDQIDQMLNINLRAAIVLAKECSRLMLLGGGGTIINISSIVGDRGFSGLSVYAATKAGMIGMTRSLARELGPRNIVVNAIAPGYLETDLSQGISERQRDQITRRTPLGRLGRTEDITPWVEFLLSPSSRFMTGQVITVDGGAAV
jgi:3-oxoacyl-[acyl-carrier protein] reductase